MPDIADTLRQMERNPAGVRFLDLCRVCDHCFGEPRTSGTSHRVYKTPWRGDPRIDIQSAKGMAKVCQVRQVLVAIALLEADDESR